ncbi:putative amino-acid metabolite efflux pump [Pseudomonas fluorescens]|uniref:EamA family transporter n=1 Tax=Pseudomonas fluorescens TaxID=294 RepID=UPI00125B4C3C|nr:EamA family transporter [Pseudomonas fluorescens]CAG8870185.1 putative amino-acid metabolite efflux pump [Pseudomonas fluorescens]VVP80162.1 putative amino-acid metabolite efflux pump [Pseudomonas fluorescens]
MKIGRLDLCAGVIVTVVWGCNFSVIGLGLKSLDPFLLTLLRFTFCAFPLVFFIKKPADVTYSTLAVYGTVFGAGLWGVVNLAISSGLSAGLSSVFLQFSAFFTIILCALFLKERIQSAHWLGMVLASTGLLLILAAAEQRSTTLGIGLVLIAAASWSLCNLIVKIKQPEDMLAFIIWSSLFSLPVVLALTLAYKGTEPLTSMQADMTLGAAFSIIFQSYITTIVGYRVWNNLMKKYPAATVAPLSLLVPVSGLISSYLFFDEVLDDQQVLAIGLIIAGIAIFISAHRIFALRMFKGRKE